MSEYNLLIHKLDEFIRKYYKNELFKGLILFLGLVLVMFLFVLLLEYFGHFNTAIRTFLFYSFLFISSFLLIKYFIRPLLHLYKFGSVITRDQAAEIIGNHFSSIKDKLLNTLHLHRIMSSASGGLELIEASINQRIREIKPLPFTDVVDTNKSKKQLKYFFIPLGLFLSIIVIFPSIFKEAGTRLIEHRTYFSKPAPFNFILLDKNLEALAHEDFPVMLRMEGKEIPTEVYLDLNGVQYLLEKTDRTNFLYTFRNLQADFKFRFFAEGFYSEEFTFTVLPKPSIVKADVKLSYPAYLQKEAEEIQNSGDLTVPAGTLLKWNFSTTNADFIKVSKDSSGSSLQDNQYNYTFRALKSQEIKLFAGNSKTRFQDTISYFITVIPDAYPEIQVEQKKDSSSLQKYFFTGLIKDDYGFKKMSFNYQVLNQEKSNQLISIPVKINPLQLQQAFFYYWDLSALAPEPGAELEYYFEIWDNDGVAGSKSTKSQVNIIKLSTKEELAENVNKSAEDFKNEIKDALKQSREIQKELADLSRKLKENKTLNWEEKNKMEQLLQKQQEAQRNINEIAKKNEQYNLQKEELNNLSPEAKERQDQLKELMESMKSEEMKKLYDELAALMEKFDNKERLQEKLEDMKINSKDLEKELSRSLELFKKLEIQQKLEENINKLNELAKNEEKLAKKSEESGKEKSEELKKEQEKLTKEFEKSMEELFKLEKEDKALEFSNDFKNPEKEEKDIHEEMKGSEEQLSEKKNNKAAQKQKKAAEQMKDLSEKLSAMKSDMESEEMEEDINSLRGLLDDLLKLSFSQEDLMDQLKKTDVNNPQYLTISQQQRKLKDNAKMIEDSLFALSKRVVQIKSIVNKEIGSINQNIEKSLSHLELREVSQARGRQQFTMTSINNLALLLNESLKEMQMQLAMAKPGMQSCKKPNGKKSGTSFSLMKQMQQQINEQMEKLSKEGKKAEKEGDQKGNGQQPGGKMSEQIAKLAAQQQALRRELQKLGNANPEKGKGPGGNLDKLGEKMEQTEKDLVNKRITPETHKRQQEILTRLLEAEKAEREREQDYKRESNEGKNLTNRNPEEFNEYKKLKLKEMELIRTVSPALNSFYKQKSIEYFNKIGN